MKKQEQEKFVLRQGYFFDNEQRPAARQPVERQQRPAPVRKQRRPFPVKAVLIAAAAVALIAVAAAFGPQLLSGVTAPSTPWSTADLVGNWAAYSDGSLAFSATVENESILINWDSGDGTTAQYWKGTFTVPSGTDATKIIVSFADQSNNLALLASTDSQKTFTVTRNTIQYQASMLGVTKTFELRRR